MLPGGPSDMPKAPLLANSLAFSLAISMGIPGSALGSTAVWQPARGSCEVDTSAVGEEGPALKKRIESRAGDILLDNEVLPAKDADDALIKVQIAPAPNDDPGWVAAVFIEQGGTVVADTTREIDCKLCTEGELVDKVAEVLAELVPTIESEPVDPDGGGAGEPEPEPEPQPETPEPKDKKLGTLGYAGIGAAALGVIGVGVGAGLIAKGEVPLDDDPAQQKNYVRPGAAALGVGGAILVAGVVLIVVDQMQQKKKRSTAFAPYFDRSGGGLAFITRF